MAIWGEMVPPKLLEFAWKRAISMKPSRVEAASWKPLKSIEAKAVAELLSGGVSQQKPL